ncbi:DUF401 family protein [candidate division KSB1 bacterium]|nr:DUF401 family protein [candidate division KSB1 bacterium]
MTTFWIWFGFFFSFGLLLIIARKSLWLGLIIASYVLGLFSLSFYELWELTLKTVSNPSIILLALAVGLIPIIGGAMESGGLMDDLVNNLRLKRRPLMAFSSAFVGLLPMPGGALLSAPLIEKSGKTVSNENKTAINVWYRHVFLLIYPLGMLLATTAMAEVNLYTVILYLILGFVLMLVLGYFFLLAKVSQNEMATSSPNLKKLLISAMVIVIAPVIHFSLLSIFGNVIQEIPLVIGVSVSIVLAFYFGKLPLRDLFTISKKMKPWNFALIIVSMFLLLNIFKASDTSKVIAEASFSKTFILVGVGFLLGFATGRVQVPISILLPIYLAQFGSDAMTPWIFTVMFFAIYQGYVVSPVHPCVSVSLEYFKTELKDFYKLLILPAIICLAIAWIVAALTF